jgi:hypothetical protein
VPFESMLDPNPATKLTIMMDLDPEKTISDPHPL